MFCPEEGKLRCDDGMNGNMGNEENCKKAGFSKVYDGWSENCISAACYAE